MLIWLLTSSFGSFSGGPALVDGNTFNYIGRLSSFHGDRMMWHPTDPDLIIYPSGNKLLKYSVSKNSSSDFFTFNGYSEVTSTGLYGGEGAPSKDGRYWMGAPKNSSGNYDLVTFDSATNTVVGTIPLPAGWGPSQLQSSPLNNWSISRKGNFIVTQSLEGWTTRSGIAVPRGLNVWSLKGALLRTFSGSGSAWHIDLAVDTDGFDVAVIVGDAGLDSAGYKVRQLRSWRLDGSYGQTPRNEGPTDMTRENWHISAPMQADGWAFVSSNGNHQSNTYAKEASLFNHIYAAKLDGSKRVAVIANARHPKENASGMSNYFYESHATARPDGSMVAWTSVWNYNAMSSPPISHLYVARGKPK